MLLEAGLQLLTAGAETFDDVTDFEGWTQFQMHPLHHHLTVQQYQRFAIDFLLGLENRAIRKQNEGQDV